MRKGSGICMLLQALYRMWTQKARGKPVQVRDDQEKKKKMIRVADDREETMSPREHLRLGL